MAKQIFFGHPTGHMQWVPAPLAGAEAQNINYVESIEYENGGADVYRSRPYRKQYDFEFSAPIKGSEGLNVFNKFASGYYGGGTCIFADPYAFETNMLSAQWASPGLIEQGWKNIYSIEPTFTDTAANVYDQPPRSAIFNVTTPANTPGTGANERFIIPVPPGYVLHLGVSGSATGTAVVQARSILSGGAYDAPVSLTLLSPTASTRMNYSASGGIQGVEVYITRTSAVASTLTLTSMMAQLWKTGITPTLTGDHVPGDGHTGLEFADDARVETYTYINPPRKALSTTLVEVGAWR